MKNIRMYDDGNRAIIVLEGYDTNVINMVRTALDVAISPLSHIIPHTGEDSFQLKGTEKPIFEKKEEIPIQQPEFMKKYTETKEPTTNKNVIQSKDTEDIESSKDTMQAASIQVSEDLPHMQTPDRLASTQETTQETHSKKGTNKDPRFMDTYELRQCLSNSDQNKLTELLRRKGRYPSLKYLLCVADNQTMRDYILAVNS